MIITTTSSIEGYRIVRHLGPVSVHMVAGTNLFSDFFASVTDIFGGTSGSYGRQLSGLYMRSTKLLEEEARRRGANAVVGLSIDFDELGAQGKSMFMLNALGTAVRVVEAGQPASAATDELDAEAVSRALRRRAVVRDLAKGGVTLSPELWDFATSERIQEFSGYVVAAVARMEESPGARSEEIEKARGYFAALGPEVAARRLFPYLAPRENTAERVRNAAADLIRRLDLMDYALLLGLLQSPDTETARRGLQVATATRQLYTAEDIERIRKVRDRVATRFVPRWQPAKVKGMFGKEHAAWSCPCGGTPGADDAYCPKCHRDTLGLTSRDVRPQQVGEHLDELLEILTGAMRPAAGEADSPEDAGRE
ncbi:MAG TPA: heavy metal-binding domain-containing protein [Longimicrobium sp.]